MKPNRLQEAMLQPAHTRVSGHREARWQAGRRSSGRAFTMTQVSVVVGAGSSVEAIARRANAGEHVLLADLNGPGGEEYRRMIEVSAVGRAGTTDEVGAVGALLMGPDGARITGSDVLMDGGVTAAHRYGELAVP